MKLKTALAILVAFPLLAQAGVNLKNGNFHISYTDVKLENGSNGLGISRVYNSTTNQLGWFGYGWGSDYETHLIVLPDGSAAIKESGAGRINYYRTENKVAIKSGVQKIVAAATKQENLTPSAASELAEKLLGNEELRLSTVVNYGIHTELAQGSSLGDECGTASLKRLNDGYRRIDCNRFGDGESAIDTFDLKGRLTRHELKSGYAVTLQYPDSGTVVLGDTLGNTITLSWTPEGRGASAKTNKGVVKYTYDDNQDLIKVDNDNGHNYRYDYDSNHNLTRVTYIDTTSLFISYSPSASGMADSVTDRLGDQQTYVYRTDPNNPNHYWTRHTKIFSNGETASREYEYENEVTTTGAIQLTRIAQSGGGISKDIKYDGQGRVIRKVNEGGMAFDYAYDPQSGKLITVIGGDLTTEFEWDVQGNLILARNNHGQVINLYYDSAQRVQRMVEVNTRDKTRRELTMEYNTADKPTEISLTGTGKITVEYDDKGEIRSVQSNQDTEIALQVSQAFQNLLSVVKVADPRL